MKLLPGLLRIAAYCGVLLVFPPAHGNEEMLRLTAEPDHWVMQGGNPYNWHYSDLDQVNNKNIGELQVAWAIATGSLQGHAGAPLVIPARAARRESDILLLHTAYPESVVAVDLDSLKVIWVYEAAVSGTADNTCCEMLNYGLSYAGGRVFIQQADNRLIAIDLRNGRPVWETTTGGSRDVSTVTNATLAAQDLVIASITGGSNGGLGAWRIRDGRPAWRPDATGDQPGSLMNTENNRVNELPLPGGAASIRDGSDSSANGVTFSGMPAWDYQAGLIFHAASLPDSPGPPADGLRRNYQTRLFARDINTGVTRWSLVLNPEQQWPYQDANPVILADVDRDGARIPALVYFSHSGLAYTLNRNTGELLAAGRFNPSANWAGAVDIQSGRPVLFTNADRENSVTQAFCPEPAVAATRQSAAYSPGTGLFYRAFNQLCQVREQGRIGPATADRPAGVIPAGQVTGNGSDAIGRLVAWDAARAEIVWSADSTAAVWSGVLATGGDVVFYGTLDGYVRAVDAKTGSLLWQFRVPSGIIGDFITWSYKDKQFIGILSGKGTRPDRAYDNPDLAGANRPGGTLMVFSLP